jgi:hypothetical protein
MLDFSGKVNTDWQWYMRGWVCYPQLICSSAKNPHSLFIIHVWPQFEICPEVRNVQTFLLLRRCAQRVKTLLIILWHLFLRIYMLNKLHALVVQCRKPTSSRFGRQMKFQKQVAHTASLCSENMSPSVMLLRSVFWLGFYKPERKVHWKVPHTASNALSC